MDTEYERAKEIIKHEPVHLLDGRYSGGNLSVMVLIWLIRDGYAVEYLDKGQTFVRAREYPQFEVE